MPDLIHSLQGRDLGFIRIVAHLWGLDLSAPDAHGALPELTGALLDPRLVLEVVETLPHDAQTALACLVQNEGRMSWAAFTRRFGTIREMGPGQRDRKKPYETPSSPTEVLWYRGMIGRAFLDLGAGPQEFAFIPDDLVTLLPVLDSESIPPPGRPATPAERAFPMATSERILDAACTLLAGLRLGWELDQIPWDPAWVPAPILKQMAGLAGLLDAQGLPAPDPTRSFLEASRGEALAALTRAWLPSTQFNELRLVPGLVCEGEWVNDPLNARQTILELLKQVPQGSWWSLVSFISTLRERQADFQRPAGDYDSWFIRDAASGEYLRGAASWDRVDGALVRFLLTGPLYWLGILDLAGPKEDAPAAAFRFSAWSTALLDDKVPNGLQKEDAPVYVTSNGRIRLSHLTPRAVRYQIARFCDWEEQTPQEFRYRVTPPALDRARKQGLRVAHLIALLRRHTSGPVPPTLVQALERWDQSGVQARLETVTLLRLGSPEILAALRRSKAARFLGDPLGPTTVIVQPGAQAKVMAVLAELGYLAEGSWKETPGV